MPTTPRQGFRYPVAGDPSDFWTYWQNLATDVDNEPGNRGTGTAFPTTNLLVGDTYYHQTLRCLCTYTGSAWRQVHVTHVTSSADWTSYRSALSSAGINPHNGFLVHRTDADYTMVADGLGFWRLLRSQDFSSGVANSMSALAWQGTTYANVPADLGSPVVIAADGINRTIQLNATVNVAGDMFMRIRVDHNGTFYFPNATGRRSITSANQEQSLSILGVYTHSATASSTIMLEARANVAGSGSLYQPQLLITGL